MHPLLKSVNHVVRLQKHKMTLHDRFWYKIVTVDDNDNKKLHAVEQNSIRTGRFTI